MVLGGSRCAGQHRKERATIANRTTPEMAPYKNPEDLEHFCKKLRKAGLPD